MFNINDYLVYKNQVCKVKDVKKEYYHHNDYYILSPISSINLTISIPTSNDDIRKLINEDEVQDIIERIPTITTIEADGRAMENEYKRLLHEGSHDNLVKIIKTAYLRNQERIEQNKKINSKDDDYFNIAETFLYDEFSIVLNKTVADTKQYVINTIKMSES